MAGPWDERLAGAALLSLWQPWASAIAEGTKAVETRAYSTRHRGWLLVHAAQHRLTKRERAALPPEVLDYGFGRTLPYGAVVAIAYLAEVLPVLDPDDPTEHRAHLVTGRHEPHHLLVCRPAEGWHSAPGGGVARHPEWDTEPIDHERPWGGYDPGRYGYVLADVLRLDQPVPARGHQGAPRAADPTVIAAVAAQLQEHHP